MIRLSTALTALGLLLTTACGNSDTPVVNASPESSGAQALRDALATAEADRDGLPTTDSSAQNIYPFRKWRFGIDGALKEDSDAELAFAREQGFEAYRALARERAAGAVERYPELTALEGYTTRAIRCAATGAIMAEQGEILPIEGSRIASYWMSTYWTAQEAWDDRARVLRLGEDDPWIGPQTVYALYYLTRDTFREELEGPSATPLRADLATELTGCTPTEAQLIEAEIIAAPVTNPETPAN